MSEPKIMIAVPMFHTVDTQFMTSLMGIKKVGKTQVVTLAGSLVYKARNALALKAIQDGFDYILWLDSDMVFEPDILEKLYAHAEDGKEYITGIYFRRTFPTCPIISKELVWKRDEKTGMVTTNEDPYMDYPRDSVFQIKASGFGLLLTKVSMLVEVAKRFSQSPFDPLPAFGEDYSFCWRLNRIGGEMWCDSSIKAGHIGTFIYNEQTFLDQLKEGDK